MKGKIKVLVLLALFVSVVIGLVAFGEVKSNALLVNVTKPNSNTFTTEYQEYYNQYVNDGLLGFFAGERPSTESKWYNHKFNSSGGTYHFCDCVNDNYSYFDQDGYHFNNVDMDYTNHPVTFGYGAEQTLFGGGVSAGKGFTVEMYLGEFHHRSKVHDVLFQIKGKVIVCNGNNISQNSLRSAELLIYYDDTDKQLGVRYPRAFTSTKDTNNNWVVEYETLYYKVSVDTDLSDKLITLVYSVASDYASTGPSVNNRTITLYIDGKQVDQKGNEKGVPTNFENSDLYAYLGSPDNNRESNFIARAVRLYSKALTAQQIEINYNVDAALYKGTGPIAYEATPGVKTTPYYGITGFDKIVKKYNGGRLVSKVSSYAANENEFLEDWDAPSWGNISLSEGNKLERFSDGSDNWAPGGDPSARATFVDIGSDANNNDNNNPIGRDDNIQTYAADKGHSYDENPKASHDAAILIENSYFLRSRFKCATGDIVKTGDKIDTESSPKLMATCDMGTRSLADVDFCGMVVDYSDLIYKYYNPEMNYFGQYWDGKYWSEDPMYTDFMQGQVAGLNYTQAELFATGVGFNIVRRANEKDQYKEYTKASVDANGNPCTYDPNFNNDSDSAMRIFVSGTHVSGHNPNGKYIDVLVEGNNTFGINLRDGNLHNFSIYRTYEYWSYATVGLIANGDPVILYKFYVDKNLVAVIGMELNSGFDKTCINQSGVICEIKKDGTIGQSVSSGVCTFRNWAVYDCYGPNGAIKGSDSTNNNGTPSGNILIAVHKLNSTFDNDPGTNFYDSNRTSTLTMPCTEENFCKVYLDNFGYMDYHNQNLTQSTYNGSYTVNQDMTFTLKSDLIFPRLVFEPDIYFNRLGYESSLLAYSDIRNTSNAATTMATPDYKASHGKAVLSNGVKNADGIIMRTNSVDGIYFKDIADNITYDLIDFNGETMFKKNLKAIDYFTTLYKLNKGTDAEKAELFEELRITELPEALTLTDNQICLMVDLIELGKAHSDYAKYWKLAGQFEGQEIGTLADFAIVSGNAPDFDTSSNIGSPYAKSLIDAKPDKISTGNDKNAQAFFKSFALSIKSYVSLLVKVQVPNTWTSSMADHFKVYYAGEGGTRGAAYNLVYYNPDDINAYHDGEVYKHEAIATVEPIEGTSSSYVTIEIKLSILDFDKQFYFELKDGSNVNSTYVYGLYDYCLSKWDNSDRTLSEFVRRAFHIGELAQYYDGSKGTFELWKNHV